MIKVNELRINNWITIDNGERPPYVYQLTGFDIYKADESECFDVKPIPLTPEILEKCGFEKDDEGFWLHDKDRVALQLEQQDYTDDSFDYHCGIRFDIGMPFNDLLIGVQYLHQLQNLYFALTGSELEINL